MPSISHRFEAFSRTITQWTGSTAAFLLALLTIVVWGVTGPVFQYSETWQLVINTGTTIITFLMVFLIQRAQNKDSLALHMKLNELIAATKRASNRLVNSEDLDEEELQILHTYFARLAAEAREDAGLHQTHNQREAAANQEEKDAQRRELQQNEARRSAEAGK